MNTLSQPNQPSLLVPGKRAGRPGGRSGAEPTPVWAEVQALRERLRAETARRTQVEAALQQAQKMEATGRLAVGVAHDFSNLLTIIGGHATLLLGAALPPEALESAQDILEASQQACNLTQQLLRFSRRQTVQPAEVELNELVTRVGRMLSPLLGTDIKLAYDLTERCPRVFADAGSLEQVILNLALNARDAMPRGGSLALRTATLHVATLGPGAHPEARPGEFAILAVSDTGCGMEPAVLNRVFDLFFTTKEAGKGTGLGLTIVQDIIRSHRGWITAASRVGEGTTFTLHLPVTGTAAPPTPTPPAPAPSVAPT